MRFRPDRIENAEAISFMIAESCGRIRSFKA
jgi:hypothetical protein